MRFFDPYCYRCSFGLTYPSCGVRCASSLEEIIQYEGPDSIAAIISEPITGANGPMVPPPEYFPMLREICDKHGILLIADEVITGFGRTGKWFGIEHWDVVPDMIVTAKGVTSGALPLSAVLMRDHIARHYDERAFAGGTTNAANPLACAVGVAALGVYREENLIERSAELGTYLLERLTGLMSDHPCVGDVRGLGLMACIEMVKDRETREPLVPWNAGAEVAGRIKKMLLERGLWAYVKYNWMLIGPPLIITEAQIDHSVAIIDEVLGEVDTMI